MKDTATLLREFFTTKSNVTPTDIFLNVDAIHIMKQIKFGTRMINEALEMVERLTMIGAASETIDIEKDVLVMRVNLMKVEKAFGMAIILNQRGMGQPNHQTNKPIDMLTATILVLSMVFFEVPQEVKVPVRKNNVNKYYQYKVIQDNINLNQLRWQLKVLKKYVSRNLNLV